ncbi:MAG: hypothetical protein HUJ68_05490 [Clostridia bacterium]|nr:hypothetical protein [Clostridia bacterium]
MRKRIFLLLPIIFLFSCRINDYLILTSVSDEYIFLGKNGCLFYLEKNSFYKYNPDLGLINEITMMSNNSFAFPKVNFITIQSNQISFTKEINKTFNLHYDEQKLRYWAALNISGLIKNQDLLNLFPEQYSKKKCYKLLSDNETIQQDFYITSKTSLAWFDDAMSI